MKPTQRDAAMATASGRVVAPRARVDGGRATTRVGRRTRGAATRARARIGRTALANFSASFGARFFACARARRRRRNGARRVKRRARRRCLAGRASLGSLSHLGRVRRVFAQLLENSLHVAAVLQVQLACARVGGRRISDRGRRRRAQRATHEYALPSSRRP